MFAVVGGVAFLLSAACVPLLVRFAVGREMLDMPNLRSSHEVPTPRLGGVAIVCGAWVGIAAGSVVYGAVGWLWPVLLAATLVALAGLADDLATVPLAVRAGTQALAALALLLAYPPPAFEALPGLAGLLLLAIGVFWVVALVNAFNFMDGIDGLVAGAALVNLAFLAAIVGGNGVFAALAGASAGFLLWNVSPASIFLGDAGSYFLGFALAAGALYVPAPGAGTVLLGLLASVLVFTPFLIDTSYTLLSRWRARKDIFSAHREHVYQRITPTGAMHRRTSVLYYGASVAAGFAALAVLGGGGAALLGVLAALGLCAGVLALPKVFGEAQ